MQKEIPIKKLYNCFNVQHTMMTNSIVKFITKKFLFINLFIFAFVGFLGITQGQFAGSEFNPVAELDATICDLCTQEGFEYTDDLKCIIPSRNAITNTAMDIYTPCDEFTNICVSVGGEYYAGGQCCMPGNVVIGSDCRPCSTLSDDELSANAGQCSDDISGCASERIYTEYGQQKCCPGAVVPDQNDPSNMVCILNNEGTAGMKMDAKCLINGQCSYNIYETIGIRKSDPDPNVGSFVKDIVLAVTTFIGTVVTIVLVVSGLLYIVAGIKGDTSMADKAKKGLFNSVVGLVLVVTSYAIVRLIQFLATAGGG